MYDYKFTGRKNNPNNMFFQFQETFAEYQCMFSKPKNVDACAKNVFEE